MIYTRHQHETKAQIQYGPTTPQPESKLSFISAVLQQLQMWLIQLDFRIEKNPFYNSSLHLTFDTFHLL